MATTTDSPPSSAPETGNANSFAAGNNSLYVGELPTDVTEAMLFEIFSQVGPVASIRVCRDAVTRRSLGYAYVNYHNPADSDRALDLLNFSEIKGKPCRIMWSQRDPSLRKRGVGNIFIKNLDKSIDSKGLYDTFSAFGSILSCKVATDENGSRGYGFVHYDTQEAADKSIKAVNGMLLNDKKVFVGHHVPRRERESKEDEIKMNFTNVFVKNMPESMDDEQLNKIFSEFGSISSAAVSHDENGKSKCFGFVNFENHEDAAKAVEALNNKEFDGRALFVGRAQKKYEREDELRRKFEQLRIERMNKYQGVNLYVKNLDEAVEDETLRQEFAAFGTITSAKIMRDEKGASKGFAFVCYAAPEEANKAVAEMNNKIIGTKPVYVALAQRKEARKAMLEAQYSARMRQGMIPMYGAMMYPGQNMPPNQLTQNGPGQQVMPGFAYPPQFRPGPGVPFMNAQYPVRVPRPAHSGRGGARPSGNRSAQPGNYGPQSGARPQGARPSYKYTSNARNQAPPVTQQQPQQPDALTAGDLARMDPAQQRQTIGERLYPLIQQHSLVQGGHQENAGKITGMLLEMEISELLNLIENPQALSEKLEEAVAVLDNFFQTQ
eukprot:Partr_v1_DN28747_c1_g1_i1_m62807 putative poly(A) binding protein, cytoplasmic